MPRPPPVTKARFPEKSITTHPHCGLGIADCGLEDRPSNPQSAIRNPRSCVQLCFHNRTDNVLDRELQLLDMRGLIGRYHEGVVDEPSHGAAALAEQRDHAGALG